MADNKEKEKILLRKAKRMNNSEFELLLGSLAKPIRIPYLKSDGSTGYKKVDNVISEEVYSDVKEELLKREIQNE